MNMELVPIKIEEKEILRNLMEKYLYEFSQYTLWDVNPLGLYGYGYIDHYWTEKGRWPYFVKVDGKIAGFVMVNDFREADAATDYTMSEFFIVYKYRRHGIGRKAAYAVIQEHPGVWQLKYHPKNIASAKFWNGIVGDLTDGNYQKLEAFPGCDYDDGTPGTILVFDTKNVKEWA